jgi:hypothetical protein
VTSAIIQMTACPGRGVQRGGNTVTGVDGRDKSLLMGEHG